VWGVTGSLLCCVWLGWFFYFVFFYVLFFFSTFWFVWEWVLWNFWVVSVRLVFFFDLGFE